MQALAEEIARAIESARGAPAASAAAALAIVLRRGMPCPMCKGEGHFAERRDDGLHIVTTCQDCGGTGVRA